MELVKVIKWFDDKIEILRVIPVLFISRCVVFVSSFTKRTNIKYKLFFTFLKNV